jgi:uncharacterized protein YdaU (DUF1376 family)
MGKVRHVDFYPDEWLAGTATLNAVEIGVYISACALIYSHGGPIEKDELRRFVICHGKTYENALARLQTLGKVILKRSKISVKRCENELEKASNRTLKATENGWKGGRPVRKINDIEKPGGFGGEKLEPKANYQPTNHQPPPYKDSPHKSPPRGRESAQAEFADWWTAYPRKVGKNAAARKYLIARKTTDAETLLAAARRYAEITAGTEKQYIAHPSTWLHQGRWTDEELNPQPPANGTDQPNGPPPRPEEIWPDLKETRH